MKPILLPALATIAAALSQPACGPAAAIGTAAWWDQQHAHDKPAKAGLCRCPDCSLSWHQESSTVPSHYRDGDRFVGGPCPGAGSQCR